jgi:hypothetical protein
MKILARSEGISDRTVNQVLDKVKHIPRVIELDRRQPEFTQTFSGYFNTRINDERIKRGRALLTQYRLLLERIQLETGIPAQYPRIGVQHQDYTIAQLTSFRSGARKNGPMMMAIANRMSDEEIKAVADYIAGLR